MAFKVRQRLRCASGLGQLNLCCAIASILGCSWLVCILHHAGLQCQLLQCCHQLKAEGEEGISTSVETAG